MPTYSLSSGLFQYDKYGGNTGNPIEAIQSVAAARFPEIELLAEGIDWATGPPSPNLYRNALQELNVYPHTIHAPHSTINLASFDETERKNSVGQVASALRFLAEIGGKTAIVHPTGRPSLQDMVLYTKENIGKATENAHRSILELVAIAEIEGVRMALENLAPTTMPIRPLDTMRELRSFMADLPAEQVGICHDIGHTRLVKLDISDEARIASDRLYALHIQDGSTEKDDHLPPGHGVLDFDSYAKALKDIEFNGAWTFEVLTRNHPESVENVALEIATIRDGWNSNGMSNIKI